MGELSRKGSKLMLTVFSLQGHTAPEHVSSVPIISLCIIISTDTTERVTHVNTHSQDCFAPLSIKLIEENKMVALLQR